MSSIIGPTFIEAVAALPKEIRPILCLPRSEKLIKTAAKLGLQKYSIVSLGLETPELEKLAKELGFDTVSIDVANAYLPRVLEKAKELSKDFKVLAGSIHTTLGAFKLIESDVKYIKLGIGPGSVCITKNKTGYTRGTISEIVDVASVKGYEDEYEQFSHDAKVIADGKFKESGDIVKAFGAGADYIMSGRLFVNAKESELRVDGSNLYYGMASKRGKKFMKNGTNFIEGKQEFNLPHESELLPLKVILEDLWDGIRSGVSYSGYTTVEDFIGNGVFEIKHK
jgi:hypothetical protein